MAAIPVAGLARGTADRVLSVARTHGAQRLDFTRDYLEALYRDAAELAINADVLVAQWDLETGCGTSAYWVRDGNPAGLAAFDDGSNWGLQFSPEKAARAHVTHMACYLGKADVPADWIATDARWQAAVDAGYFGSVRTIDDLGNGRWATDPEYARKLKARYDRYGFGEAGRPDEPEEENGMTFTTDIPGLPGGPLTTQHPVRVKLIAQSNTYQRPGRPPAGQRIMIQHGTGNPRSMAAGEASWLVDSRASGNQQSYHYITDDRETWVCLPINEHGWHAADGGGPGNLLGIACEMVENNDLWASDSRALQCIENAAEIMGRTAARMNAVGPKQHWDFNYMNPPRLRHDCPNKLRYRQFSGRLGWEIYCERYEHYKADELSRMGGGGGTIVQPDTYEQPIPVPGLTELAQAMSAWGIDGITVKPRTVRAKRSTPRCQDIDTDGPRIGPDISAGETFAVIGLVEDDGRQWYITPYFTRVLAEDTEPVETS